MNEYRVKVSVRNNLILEAIERMGYTNLQKFAKDQGLKLHSLYDMINLRKAPISSSGEFSPIAMELMEVLGACPTDLWTEDQLRMELRSNTTERVLSKEAMMDALTMNTRAAIELVEDKITREDLEKLVSERIDALTPSEAEVIKMRYGFGEYEEHTLEEVAKKFPKVYANGDVSTYTAGRIRQIEAKALRKLRGYESYFNECKKLKIFIEN